MTRIVLAVIFVCVAGLALLTYLNPTDRFGYITRHRVVVEVDGRSVSGDVTGDHWIAILTRRDKSHEHSYLINYAGDADGDGNIGTVTDCHAWVAPRVPFLILRRGYPPCSDTPEEASTRYIKGSWQYSLRGTLEGVKFFNEAGEKIVFRPR